jgi:arylsulfatase A-like enzyme
MRVRNAMLSSATAWIVGVWLLAVFSQTRAVDAADRALRPNIVLIVADDLGYGDVGCYGQRVIKTPNIDRLAAAGMRFTDCYAGSTVCAPSRCVLMTGRHTGHARIRGNGLTPLAPDDVTVAEVLKSAGYATGMFGKWGLGEPDTTGVPNKQGFDEWFGYLNQHHAHNYYPDYLWKNDRKVTFDNVVENNVATRRVAYSADLLTREALDFLDRHRADHFFLYLPFTLPHANNEAGQQGMEVPSDAPYTHESWPQPQKNHGAMITYLDAQVGKVLARLSELKLDDDTIVFFTSDNGPHREGGADPAFFHSTGPLRGFKRALYEGGIRVPMIARYPGHIAPASVSSQVWAFWDVLPTLAELAGAPAGQGLDGISMVPALLGESAAGRPQQNHEYLYWEFHERGFARAVRMDNWKAVRPKPDAPLELYDLATDLGERHDVANEHADIVGRVAAILTAAHTESPDWPTGAKPAGADPSLGRRGLMKDAAKGQNIFVVAWKTIDGQDHVIEHYTEEISLDPKNAKNYLLRGNVWGSHREYDKAIKDYTEAIGFDPKGATPYTLRAYAWDSQGDFDKAIKDYTEAIRLAPNRAWLYTNRGQVWTDKGEFENAITDHTEAIWRDPKLARAYNNLAWLRATCSNERYRDGEKALANATTACRLTAWKDGGQPRHACRGLCRVREICARRHVARDGYRFDEKRPRSTANAATPRTLQSSQAIS